MNEISRRKLITGGLAVAAGASGVAVAAKLAQRHGLIPPDAGGFYGPGETLTYAAQRLVNRHAMAREFSRSEISKNPFANGRAVAATERVLAPVLVGPEHRGRKGRAQ